MAKVDFNKSALGIIFRIISWIFKKIFGIKSGAKTSDDTTERPTKTESKTNDYTDIGTVEQDRNSLKVYDTNGRLLYSGNGGQEGKMVHSSKIIVIQNGNSVTVFAIYNKSLKKIYSGNSLKGDSPIVSASEFSFFTKSGNENCKYTISNGSCKNDYCRNY